MGLREMGKTQKKVLILGFIDFGVWENLEKWKGKSDKLGGKIQISPSLKFYKKTSKFYFPILHNY